MATADDELALLREAHTTHRNQISLLQSRVQRLEDRIGKNQVTPFTQPSLQEAVTELRAAVFHDSDAKLAIEQMRKLADSIYGIFHAGRDEA